MSAEAAAAAGDFFKTLIGEKRLGAVAPAFQPGSPMSLLGQTKPNMFLEQLLRDPTAQMDPVSAALASRPKPDKLPMPAVVQDPEPEPLGGFEKKPKFPIGEDLGELRPKLGLLGRFDNFFGNLDEGLQSPSRIIAMGLLNRVDPRLGMAGLALQGLLGDRKVF